MNRTEKALWKRISKTGTLPGKAQRVENRAMTGFPDVYAVCNGRSYWVELKVSSRKKAGTPTEVFKMLEPSQVIWLHTFLQEKVTAFILIGHSKGLHLYKVGFIPDLRYMPVYKNNGKLTFNIPLKIGDKLLFSITAIVLGKLTNENIEAIRWAIQKEISNG